MKSHAAILTLLLVSLCATAQVHAASTPVTVRGSELRAMKSTNTGRSYDLYIRKPSDFDRNTDKYPVLYLLDGQWDFKLLDSIVGGLVYDKVMPTIVVVGITYSGDDADYGKLRAMDYTPTPWNGAGTSGDAAKFLKFINTEVIPLVEQNYRGDPKRRILGGHSLGGLFTLYAMFTEPAQFWGYLSGSPYLPWDNQILFKQEAEFFAKRKNLPVRLYMAVGGSEDLVVPDVNFSKTLASRNYKGLQWDARVIEGEGHGGVKPEFYNRGLRFLFGPQ